jgi:hypothetical protein
MADGAILTVAGLVQGVYDYCGNPTEDKLPPSTILNALYDRIQHYKNELDITNEGWRLEPYTLYVQARKEEYTIEDGSFGRPFFVETYDPNNTSLRRREIPIIRAQDRDLYTETADVIGNNTKYNAKAFIFRNIGQPAPTVQVLPIPQRAASYRIWHESIITDELQYSDTPNFLRQFFPLLKVDVCMDVLPTCGWPAEIRDGIMQQRQNAKQQYYETFYSYIQEAYHSQTTSMRSANSSRRGMQTQY